MRFQDLIAYKKGFQLSMKIFNLSKSFPREEQYSLTDQIRRSSRSVCTNLAESYRKRNYPKSYASKLTDSDAENSETQVWLEFALECKYLDKTTFDELTSESEEVGKLLNYMILNPNKFGVKTEN
ncbi:MAG: four helix bundle protein [Flavobacteriaceae bacterium]|nr:four helix bundle protein [Flavobacteriaceae bacterium]